MLIATHDKNSDNNLFSNLYKLHAYTIYKYTYGIDNVIRTGGKILLF